MISRRSLTDQKRLPFRPTKGNGKRGFSRWTMKWGQLTFLPPRRRRNKNGFPGEHCRPKNDFPTIDNKSNPKWCPRWSMLVQRKAFPRRSIINRTQKWFARWATTVFTFGECTQPRPNAIPRQGRKTKCFVFFSASSRLYCHFDFFYFLLLSLRGRERRSFGNFGKK